MPLFLLSVWTGAALLRPLMKYVFISARRIEQSVFTSDTIKALEITFQTCNEWMGKVLYKVN